MPLIIKIYFVKISSEFTLFKNRIGHVAPTEYGRSNMTYPIIIWKSQRNYTYEGGNMFLRHYITVDRPG